VVGGGEWYGEALWPASGDGLAANFLDGNIVFQIYWDEFAYTIDGTGTITPGESATVLYGVAPGAGPGAVDVNWSIVFNWQHAGTIDRVPADVVFDAAGGGPGFYRTTAIEFVAGDGSPWPLTQWQVSKPFPWNLPGHERGTVRPAWWPCFNVVYGLTTWAPWPGWWT
jgi:hypothetical protein